MTNSTAMPAEALGTFFHQTLPDGFTAFVTFLVSYLGEATTFVLLYYLTTKLTSLYNGLYFDYVARNGLYEQYRIQNDRKIPDELQELAWENRHGVTGYIGLFTTGLPLMYLAYFVMNRLFGIGVFRMPKSYGEAAWEFFIGTVVWDAVLFWIHYGLHCFPYLYQTIHKKHHEFKTVSTITGGHLTFLDFILMDYLPTRIGIIAGNMSFPVMLAWLAFYTHIASRAHCGYALPWDPLNWLMPYVENHDWHHRRNNSNYQTLFFYWDWIVGGFNGFWEFRRKRWGGPEHWIDGQGIVDSDRAAYEKIDGTVPVGDDTMKLIKKKK
ncbi:hypothetical protein DFJ74DRAFT_687458 [Hyaloraphidium curvatum]|nr:hypothetical protein DFJ74DRAFT_687458 [Hyaloraphidium curvatum]